MKAGQRLRVQPEQLRWTLDPQALGICTTEEVEPAESTPGQHRAVRALEIGLGLRSRGFNVFLSGEAGTHRTETLDRAFEEIHDPAYVPDDFCYVENFHDPDLPRLLKFPVGDGAAFRDAMAEAVARLRTGIPRLLGSDVFSKRRRARVHRYGARMEELAAPLREKAHPHGLELVQVQAGEHADADLLPMVNGEPVPFEDLEGMVEREQFARADLQNLLKARDSLSADLRTFSENAEKLAGEASRELMELDREMTRPHLNLVLSSVYRRFGGIEGVSEYLYEVREFLENRIDIFRRGEDDGDDAMDDARDAYRALAVNLVLDNSRTDRRPVVYETNPTVANLRGVVGREVLPGGRVISDFSHIKAGSLLRAHGGFLVFHADDMESEGTAAWNLIKRTLRSGELRIEAEPGDAQPGPRAIRPQPIPVDVKVVVIGSPELYGTLLDADPDFPKLFKVKADFDSEMELSPQSIREYCRLIRTVCDADRLPPFAADGVAAVVEFGVRLAGQRNRLSTLYAKIEDLTREAAFWTRRRGAERIEARDVEQAMEERRSRANLLEERTQRAIREGHILVDTDGAAIGQVNGLTIADVGDYRFGRPARITATAAVGTAGIINIEHQASLSGSYHDKGLLILSGFLRETFAVRHPLAVSAAITLEQSYSEVDGDSATAAETLALLSALARLPIRQDLGITASMDQKGRIQAVGGVNEKVEGFFDLCAARGLTGKQGVVLPAANLSNLMLARRVVEAVEGGRFHIYGVSTIGEVVELATGVAAGKRSATGRYPKTSAFGRVADRLAMMARAARVYGVAPSA